MVAYLVQQHNFTHFSSRELITEEVEIRGLEATRQNFRIVANDMRRQHGNDVLVVRALEKMAAGNVSHAVIESIRTTAEVATLKEHGGILLAVDADQALRYKRITSRQSSSDQVSFEEFVAQEELEMNDPDPNGMQKAQVMAAADHTIMNDGSFDELKADVEAFITTFHD